MAHLGQPHLDEACFTIKDSMNSFCSIGTDFGSCLRKAMEPKGYKSKIKTNREEVEWYLFGKRLLT